ncbi:MAG: VWA domain-containing protein [Gammaproteobacteria bacterium]|nr:VWA domain-containing protein [Gammaproteobacteria bacterium]
MDFSFSVPIFGLLILLVPLVWFLPRQPTLRGQSMLRSILLVLLTVALMQPVVLSSQATKHFAIVLDQSNSLDEAIKENARQTTLDLVENLSADGDITLVQIGGPGENFTGVRAIHMEDENRSSLSDGLALAAQVIPLGVQASITLISDGLSTDTHWGIPLQGITERAIPVNSVYLESTHQDLYPSTVLAQTARLNSDMALEVGVVGTGSDLILQVLADQEILTEDVFDAETSPTTRVLSFKAPERAFVELTIQLVVDAAIDSDLSNNTLKSVVAVQPAFRILYVRDQESNQFGDLQRLLGTGFQISSTSVTELGTINISEFDVVWLDDVPADLLSIDVQENLKRLVATEGIGLIVSGGKRSFGDGGYSKEPIADALPIKIQGKQDNIDPSVALAIILDTSGSMAGSRIELAKHIARVAVRRLQPHDRIGIVEFYGNKHWAVPMQPASTKIEIDRAIGRMKAIGGTVLYPAVQEAYYGLKNVNTRFKHIVLITDAGVEDANYEAMVRKISKDRINVTTILVGQGGHNLMMSNIANWGQGRFYSVGNQFQLVDLILKQPSLATPPLFKTGEFSLSTKSNMSWLQGIEDGIPAIAGYSEVEKRPKAQVLVKEAETEHPILASWQYGLGKVTTLTTEPLGSSTQSWQEWPEYPEFLGRLVALTSTNPDPYKIDLQRLNNTVYARLAGLQSAEAPSLVRFQDSVASPEFAEPVALAQMAPNLYQARFDIPNNETIYLGIEDTTKQRWIYAVDQAASDQSLESQVHPEDALSLQDLAEFTGGQVLSQSSIMSLESLSLSPGELSFVVTRLWPWLVLLALIVYFGELVYRRWPR